MGTGAYDAVDCCQTAPPTGGNSVHIDDDDEEERAGCCEEGTHCLPVGRKTSQAALRVWWEWRMQIERLEKKAAGWTGRKRTK
jgi:hypothetical protein